jgi:hypothetical protein
MPPWSISRHRQTHPPRPRFARLGMRLWVLRRRMCFVSGGLQSANLEKIPLPILEFSGAGK